MAKLIREIKALQSHLAHMDGTAITVAKTRKTRGGGGRRNDATGALKGEIRGHVTAREHLKGCRLDANEDDISEGEARQRQ